MPNQKPIEYHFRALGLEPGATLDEVKEAYKFLVQTFHEDKYPAGHMRDKAKEKMITINEAYDQLKTFFRDNPSGAPADGWTAEQSASSTQETAGSADGMDWQAWQNKQTNSANDEVKQWQEQEKVRRETVKTDEAKGQRRAIANWGRVALWAALVVMWSGHGCSGQMHEYTDDQNMKLAWETLQYNQRMGTASQADVDRINSMRQRYSGDAGGYNGSMIFLYVYLAGMVYLTFAGKPNKVVTTWIETGEFKT